MPIAGAPLRMAEEEFQAAQRGRGNSVIMPRAGTAPRTGLTSGPP